jgi:preprotein translocase subunit SecG
MLSIVINLLLAIHVIVSFLIIFVVLMQRPKNEGLGAAFGGGMTENLFGAQTTNVLQKATRWLGALFFSLTLLLSMLYARQANVNAKTDIQRQLSSVPKPLPLATASPAATGKSLAPSASPAPSAVEATPAPSAAASATPATPGGPKKDSKEH